MIVSLYILITGLILVIAGALMLIFLQVNGPLGIILIAIGLLIMIRGIGKKDDKQ